MRLPILPKVVLIHPLAGIDWKKNSAISAVEIARHLDNYFEVTLLSGSECGSFSLPIKSLPRSGIYNLTHCPPMVRMLRGWLTRSEVALEHLTSFIPCLAYLLKNPVDLILPQNGYGSLLVAACVRAIKGTPILFTEYNGLKDGKRYLKHDLSLKPDRLIVLNPTVAKSARQINPELPINVIPYGIDLTEFSPEGKAIVTGLPQPNIICVTALERDRERRIELTIRAVSRLPHASLLICGDGTDRDYFQDFGDRLLGTRRFQIKSFAYAQMPQVYRSANVFTCATKQESHGLKYIEAMASGLPVVVPDDAVRRYLIGDGGIACDVSDLDIYTKSLQNVLQNYWYWQHKPRQNALRFGWENISLLHYQAVLKTIANASNKSARLHHSQTQSPTD